MQSPPPLELSQSSNGRVSGKPWKAHNTPTLRSQQSEGLKTKWEVRMENTKKAAAIKKLQQELKGEKQTEYERRRQISMERKKAAEDRRRLEEAKAQMGARKAARLRRRAGRTKKVNG